MEKIEIDLFAQIERVKNKLDILGKADQNLKQFGSERHKYKLNSILSESAVSDFENEYAIKLPLEYRSFLKNIGNGGAGPFYGIEKLFDSVFEDLDYKRGKINLTEPFPHSEAWNLNAENFSDYDDFEKTYFDVKHSNGLLRLCNFGCRVYISLVVNGAEYGNMWTDDRGNDGGIYPSSELGNKGKVSFLDWYELWFDNSLEELKK